ncbi:ABC-F family ATP-binding cassette domain-containing protein [Pediococcus damnosus]|uniref:ABC-F family ATP-binding cassette domain-containing protein n=1 Tax=Pediococcus damnosus TaxID=51663 RepID=UPI00061F2FFA|nr:ABC-F family ATP-binding cassette domain-containing protein [Pediococcus damnosus]KJU73414.1 multidrug ABC transporter ATP-binding protein [Pediococcus damnosus LMG 28219]PIO86232.1 multidrug ABC transporter ATP-binding protein [Pediococcus damnosus]PJE50289.1 ABC transporter ATP-binding protein [Pediococcus damnosus]
MILLQAQNVSREFSGEQLFSQITFDIQEQDRIGLVGRNGAGKTTLLKMLIGQTQPDEGQIITKKGLSIGYLAQNQGLNTDNTIWNELLTVFSEVIALEQEIHKLEAQLGDPKIIANPEKFKSLSNLYDQKQQTFKAKNGFGYQAEIRGVLNGFSFGKEFYDRSVNSLSGGQKTKLALAKLLLEQHDLLVLDEPTNHLDMDTLAWLEKYIKSYDGALLIVSHDRYFLDHVVTRVLDLDQQTLFSYTGNYSDYIDKKAARLKSEWKTYEKQQTKIDKLQDFVNKNIVRASTTKRAQSRRKQLEKMTVLERPNSDDAEMHFHFAAKHPSGNVVLTVKDAAIGYEADHVLSAPINIDLTKHHVLGIVGPNGVGKSTLLKSILGLIPFLSGTQKLGTGVEIGYYDQEQHNLDDRKTVLNELWDEHPLVPEKDIRSLLGSFLFSGDDVSKLVKNLSGGERARLLLTKLTMQADNFLILDEPTNHLDIDSREVLENALNEFDGTVLFVSHDRYFINRVATEILEISPNGSQLFLGDYDYYVAKKEALNTKTDSNDGASKAESNATSKKQTYQASKDAQKAQRKLQREIEKLEKQLDTLSEAEAQIQTKMAEPQNFNDHLKLEELQTNLDKTQAQITQTENEWTSKSEQLESQN